MRENVEKILDVVCDVCCIDKSLVLSTTRAVPIPQVRGLFWYSLRKSFGFTNEQIAKETATNEHQFTPAGVGMAIVRILNSITTDAMWKARWLEIVEILGLAKRVDADNSISVSMTVPRGFKDKVKVDIKERTI